MRFIRSIPHALIFALALLWGMACGSSEEDAATVERRITLLDLEPSCYTNL